MGIEGVRHLRIQGFRDAGFEGATVLRLLRFVKDLGCSSFRAGCKIWGFRLKGS